MKSVKWLHVRVTVVHPDGSRVTNAQIIERLAGRVGSQSEDFEIIEVKRAAQRREAKP